MIRAYLDTLEKLDRALINYELHRLTDSIKTLSNKSWWWDFWVPMLTAGLVAVIASVLTYRLTKRMQSAEHLRAKKRHEEDQLIAVENRKRAAINELTLLANSCYTSLASIRENYTRVLDSDIRERIFNVELIEVVPLVPVNLDIIERLLFLTPRDKDEKSSKWSQFTRIENVFRDYNLTMYLWRERNKMLPDFYIKLADMPNKPRDRKVLVEGLNQNLFSILFHSTERCVSMTKQVSFELNDLIEGFEKAYLPKLNFDLPRHLLTDIYEISKDNLEARKTRFADESLADFTYLKDTYFKSDEGRFKEKVRGLISRYDYDKYGV